MKSSRTGFRRLFKADKLLSQPVTPENDSQLGHLAPARGKLAARAASIAYLSVGISHGKRALSYARGRRVREAPLWSRAKLARWLGTAKSGGVNSYGSDTKRPELLGGIFGGRANLQIQRATLRILCRPDRGGPGV